MKITQIAGVATKKFINYGFFKTINIVMALISRFAVFLFYAVTFRKDVCVCLPEYNGVSGDIAVKSSDMRANGVAC